MVDILLFSMTSMIIIMAIFLMIITAVEVLYKTFLNRHRYILYFYHRKNRNGEWKKNKKLFKTVDSRDKFILKKIYKDKNYSIDYVEINHYK